MKTGRVNASVVVCERILNEIDGFISAIRIGDLFLVAALPKEVPMEMRVVGVCAAVSVRLLEHDQLEQFGQVKLIRPSGEESLIGETPKAPIEQKVAGVPGGYNFAVQIGVIPKELGLHSIVALFDGEEVARGTFTLAQQQEAATDSPTVVVGK